MQSFSEKDTICAIATPPGLGGLGVVRISGPRSREILSKLWRGQVSVSKFRPRTLYLGDITVFSNSRPKGNGPDEGFLDRAMAVFMPAPNTYTGEDIVELSCHGSPLLLSEIINSAAEAGARPAGPGEFTRRAFMAGKIDLVQAEGVADLIAATGERAARLAAEQLAGKLSETISSLGRELASIRAEVEAAIDFPEEEIDLPGADSTSARLEGVCANLDLLRSTFREGRLAREGVRVAIAGKPNAGKSSVMNRLCNRERAIVHSSPGTTRDVIEEAATIGGICFHLRDTAGLRAEAGEVEALGIARTHDEIASADIIVAVFDGSISPDDSDASVISRIDPARTIAVINKSDLPMVFDPKDLFGARAPSPPLSISAKSGAGFDELARELCRRTSSKAAALDGVVVTNARHKALLDEAGLSLDAALASFGRGEPAELSAQHLASAQEALGRITGAVTTEELLDRIFSSFCIGK